MKTFIKLAAVTAILLPIVLTLFIPALREPTTPAINPAEHQGPDHPVTLTEFADFRCPHCAKFAAHAIPALKEDFFNSGTVEYEYRHFPILGRQSTAAAEAAECAKDQNRFQDYHDVLYDIVLSPYNKIEFNPANLIELSRLMGMDHNAFHSCVMNRTHKASVLEDATAARAQGALGTPALFIDGRPLPWTDYEDLKQQITLYLDLHSSHHD